MTKPIGTEGIEKATGKSWKEWVKYLDSIGAKDLPHKEIAQKVHKHGSPGWWAQTITVAYEQRIGRRQPGQGSDGTFEVSASKTIHVDMEAAMKLWLKAIDGKKEFDGVVLARAEATKSEKWRYWNAGLADGSRITVSIYQKAPGTSSLGLGHVKLKSEQEAERWRSFWKRFLAELS